MIALNIFLVLLALAALVVSVIRLNAWSLDKFQQEPFTSRHFLLMFPGFVLAFVAYLFTEHPDPLNTWVMGGAAVAWWCFVTVRIAQKTSWPVALYAVLVMGAAWIPLFLLMAALMNRSHHTRHHHY